MALPADVNTGEPGHLAHHEEVHGILNGLGATPTDLSPPGLFRVGGGTTQQWHHRRATNTDYAWYRAATITGGGTIYSGAAFDVRIIDTTGNWGQELGAPERVYRISINHSQGSVRIVQQRGLYASEYVRIVKPTSTTYELQIRVPASYRYIVVQAQVLVNNDSTVVWENPSGTLPAGATTGTIYMPTDAWINATLENGWVSYGTSWYPASYMKDSDGFVHLRGLIKSGTLGATALTLPAGYRTGLGATTNIHSAGIAAGAYAYAYIQGSGAVILHSSNTWWELGSITPFRAEA